MRDELFALCRRYADAHVDSSGVAVTPVSGITLVRALHPGDLQAAIARPLVAMLLQGRKSVTTGLASFDYGPGEAMVIAADVPTTSEITEASQRFPYYALVLELDLAILRELRRDFMQPVSVDALADAAGMSVSVFHRHFRAMTTLSPLQFQKQLRLIHARRLMLAEGMSIAQAAGEVGYISVSQFTREYARLYGAPPGRDRRREKMSA